MTEQRHTVCRICHVACDLLVSVENGEVRKIYGDKKNPVYHGYSCLKGRVAGNLLNSPSRLLHSLERQPDGSCRAVEAQQAIKSVAARLNQIIDQHGPRSVALLNGTYCTINRLFDAFVKAFMRSVGSPMVIDNVTIDQSGRSTAPGLHGVWLAGAPPMDEWDALLLVGVNPIVSMNGGLGMNPARRLKRLRQRGMKLVVVDPRRTECAAQADIHLQPVPGEDVAILAGLVRQILIDDRIDHEFVAAETSGIESLREAVMPFTPAIVAERAGIDADDLVEAARILGTAHKGAVSLGTGAHMSGNPTTVEYMGRVLTSLRGWWLREGEEVANPGVFIEPLPPIAGSMGPTPVEDTGVKMIARGITASQAGIPVSAVPDEILTPGEGQIRALIVAGGNPVLAWPDQAKTVEALANLDLLVCIDPFLSATAEMADYVLAPKMGLECETNSSANEMWALAGPGWGYDKPYGQVSPPVVEPPVGSDLLEDWEFIFELAQAMDLQLKLHALSTIDPEKSDELGTQLDMTVKPTTSEVWALAFNGAPVPYEEVRSSPDPRLFDRPKVIVQPRPADWEGRLDIAAKIVVENLATIAHSGPNPDEHFPFRLISRRLNDVVNSCAHDNRPQLRKWAYNPAFMHPSDLDRLGISAGALVEIKSATGRIVGVAEADPTVREGCVSMPHSWGRHPDRSQRPRVDGGNTGRLVSIDHGYEKLTGQPRMTAIPISLSPVPECESDPGDDTVRFA